MAVNSLIVVELTDRVIFPLPSPKKIVERLSRLSPVFVCFGFVHNFAKLVEFKLQVMQKITILKIKSTNLIKLYFINQYTAFLNFISSLKKVKIEIAAFNLVLRESAEEL